MVETTSGIDASPVRGRIPSISPAHAQRLRSFYAMPMVWTLPEAIAYLTRGEPRLDAMPVEIERQAAAIAFDSGAEAPRLGGMDWRDYSGIDRTLAWTIVHERWIESLSRLAGTAILPAMQSVPSTGPLEWLSFSLNGDERDATGAIGVPPAMLTRFIQRSDATDPLAESLHAWAGFALSSTILLSGPRLPLGRLRAIVPGDVLVCGRRTAPNLFHAGIGRLRWPLQADPEGWRIAGEHTTWFPQESNPMNETAEANVADHEDLADPLSELARDIPLDVDFVLGRLDLPLSELAQLQPGYVFLLPGQIEGANVEIRANGRSLGRGELVAVGETIGVRLLYWN